MSVGFTRQKREILIARLRVLVVPNRSASCLDWNEIERERNINLRPAKGAGVPVARTAETHWL